MAKISPVSAKYIIHAVIDIEGVVDRPDVIGAIFGQTEGLLGSDLELRELQRSGRIGRIEVNFETSGGRTRGTIIIPSSLDKAETAIVGAALEVIDRIGPCNSKIKIDKIEDVRISKRNIVIERAKQLLKRLMDNVLPDSQELTDEVAASVRVMEIQEYGKDRLAAGPNIDESEEIIVVEGRADVINLLKHGFKNAIAMNGTSVPHTIIDLSKRKIITAFVDGDRGGNLIIKDLLSVADVDYVTKAPDGKEVEEITKKEIHKALRSRITAEQAKMELQTSSNPDRLRKKRYLDAGNNRREPARRSSSASPRPPQIQRPKSLTSHEKESFKKMLEDLIGTRGAYILDKSLNILGKVPLTELISTLKSLGSGVYAVVFDGEVNREIAQTAEKVNAAYVVGMDSNIKKNETRVNVITINEL